MFADEIYYFRHRLVVDTFLNINGKSLTGTGIYGSINVGIVGILGIGYSDVFLEIFCQEGFFFRGGILGLENIIKRTGEIKAIDRVEHLRRGKHPVIKKAHGQSRVFFKIDFRK